MSRNGMRFASLDDLPPRLRDQVRKQLGDPVVVRKTTAVGKSEVPGVGTTPDGTSTAVRGYREKNGATVITSIDTLKPDAPKKRGKYGNTATHVDGIRFDSKREAAYYQQLKLHQAAGEVSYFLRQVPLHLPGGTRYVVDFLVFFTDGRVPQYVDAKGHETPIFRLKRREIEHHYPIKLVMV